MNWIKRTALLALRRGVRLPVRGGIERFACLAAIRDILRRGEIDCVVDVGANRGQFGHDLRSIGYKDWIVSFEPSPDDFHRLRQRADPKWISYQIALSSEDGSQPLNLMNVSVFNSFLTPLYNPVAKTVIVPTRRLDGLFDGIASATGARRLFLKLDTQGFDVEVVKGSSHCISRFYGLLSELSVRPIYAGMPPYTEALTLYEALGFRLHSLHVINRSERDAVLEYDGLFVRE